MQVVLHLDTGVINLNYQEMSETYDVFGATVGVENSTGSAGLQITYYTTGWTPTSFTSLEIAPREPWLHQGSANIGIGAMGAGYLISGNDQFDSISDIGAKNIAIGYGTLGLHYPTENTSTIDVYDNFGGGNKCTWGGNTCVGAWIMNTSAD